MIKLCKQNKNSVLEKIINGQLDAVALSTSNLVDDIILAMPPFSLAHRKCF